MELNVCSMMQPISNNYIFDNFVLTMSYNEESEPALERNAIAGQSKTLYLTYA